MSGKRTRGLVSERSKKKSKGIAAVSRLGQLVLQCFSLATASFEQCVFKVARKKPGCESMGEHGH